MNGLLNQTAQQELARQYRQDLRGKSIRARLIQEKAPKESAPRKKGFRPTLNPKLAFFTAVVTLTVILIAQNVALAVGGGGGGGGLHLVM